MSSCKFILVQEHVELQQVLQHRSLLREGWMLHDGLSNGQCPRPGTWGIELFQPMTDCKSTSEKNGPSQSARQVLASARTRWSTVSWPTPAQVPPKWPSLSLFPAARRPSSGRSTFHTESEPVEELLTPAGIFHKAICVEYFWCSKQLRSITKPRCPFASTRVESLQHLIGRCSRRSCCC